MDDIAPREVGKKNRQISVHVVCVQLWKEREKKMLGHGHDFFTLTYKTYPEKIVQEGRVGESLENSNVATQ